MPSELAIAETRTIDPEMDISGETVTTLEEILEDKGLTRSTNAEEDATRFALLNLHQKGEEIAFRFCLLLGRVQKDSLYRMWGYASFDAYVEQELDVGLRQAQQVAQVGNYFGSLPPAYQELAQELGPTKARLLVGMLDKPEDYTRIRAAALQGGRKGGKMSLRELEAYVNGDRQLEDKTGDKGAKKPSFKCEIGRAHV